LRGIDDTTARLAQGLAERGAAPDDAGGAEVGLVGVGLGGHLRGPEGLAGLGLDVDTVVRAEEEVDEVDLSKAGYAGGLARHVVFRASLARRGEGAGVLNIGDDEL